MRILSIIENTISSLLFLAGVGVSLYAVFLRYVIGSSHSWTTEVFTMLIVWAVFIGFSTALRDDQHISIDILYDRVGPKAKKAFEVIVLIVGIAFSVFFMWTGFDMVVTAYNQGIKTIDAGFPIWIHYTIMPVAGLLLLIRFLERGYKIFIKKEELKSQEVDTEWQQ